MSRCMTPKETRRFVVERTCPQIRLKNLKKIIAALPLRVAVYAEPEENLTYACDADKIFRVHWKSLNSLRKEGLPIGQHKILYVCEHMGRMEDA